MAADSAGFSEVVAGAAAGCGGAADGAVVGPVELEAALGSTGGVIVVDEWQVYTRGAFWLPRSRRPCY